MFFAKAIKEILNILQTDISPNQVAAGACLGIFLGLVPGLLMKCIIFFFIMILRVNVGSALLAGGIFAVIGFFTDPLSDKIGFLILNAGFLVPLWTSLFNMALVPFTKFNNTVVMGNMAISAVLIIPAFIFSKKFILYYREHWREKVAKWKIIKLLTAGNLSYKILK